MKPVYQAKRGIHIGENVALNKNIILSEFKLNIGIIRRILFLHFIRLETLKYVKAQLKTLIVAIQVDRVHNTKHFPPIKFLHLRKIKKD